MSKIVNAITDIDDDLVIEALDYKRTKSKFKRGLFLSLTCALALALVFTIKTPDVSDAKPTKPTLGLVNSTKPMYMKVNNKLYQYDGYTTLALEDKKYEMIGKIKKLEALAKLEDFYSTDFKVGDEIYYSKEYPNEVFIQSVLKDYPEYYRFKLVE